MDRQQVLGTHVVRHRPGLFRRGVGLHIGVVTPDAENRQIDAAQIFEMVLISAVPAVENAVVGGLHQVGVVSAMLIEKCAGAPVIDFAGGELQAGNLERFTPLQFRNAPKAEIANQIERLVG